MPQDRDVAADDPMPEDGLGVPSPGGMSGREALTTDGRAADARPAAPGWAPLGRAREAGGGRRAPLFPPEESARWEARLRQTAAGFEGAPRAAVEEADRALEEIATRFGEAVTRRRRTLRMSWRDGQEDDTEQLRLALRDYRELAERLLHL